TLESLQGVLEDPLEDPTAPVDRELELREGETGRGDPERGLAMRRAPKAGRFLHEPDRVLHERLLELRRQVRRAHLAAVDLDRDVDHPAPSYAAATTPPIDGQGDFVSLLRGRLRAVYAPGSLTPTIPRRSA